MQSEGKGKGKEQKEVQRMEGRRWEFWGLGRGETTEGIQGNIVQICVFQHSVAGCEGSTSVSGSCKDLYISDLNRIDTK